MRGRHVFTPQNLALVNRMAAEGSSAREIAKAIGSTPASVRVVCSRQRIKLRRGRGRAVSGHNPLEHLQVPVVVYMTPELYAEFKSKAKDVQKPASTFASILLEAIAAGDLYKAVLDEGEAE